MGTGDGAADEQKLVGTTPILHTLRDQSSKLSPTVPYNMDGQEKKVEGFLSPILGLFS